MIGNCILFTWPRVRPDKTKQETRLGLYTAWRCRLYTRVLIHIKKGREHKCEQLPDKIIKNRLRRLNKDERSAPKHRHGIDPTVLSRTFATARKLLGGEAVDP